MSGEEGDEGERSLVAEEMTVLDFDVLCATVASQTLGLSIDRRLTGADKEDGGGMAGVGGVQRMWEGGLFDCLEDRRITVEAACCPSYRFGKNMERSNLGSCCTQGFVHVMLIVAELFCFIAFGVTTKPCFLYLGLAFFVTTGTYLGYFRTRIRKKFNIRGSSSSFEDCFSHLFCSFCSLSQEARTLEMNNVQGGVWHGRGDTICIGSHGEGSKALSELHQPSSVPTKLPDLCGMERGVSSHQHSWNADASHSQPLVPLSS